VEQTDKNFDLTKNGNNQHLSRSSLGSRFFDGWQLAATWVNTTRYCKYSQVLLMMGENRAKHVEPTWNNKLIYIVHVVSYFHSCITMHGFINVKESISTQYQYVHC
jgi:hypothetical protein